MLACSRHVRPATYRCVQLRLCTCECNYTWRDALAEFASQCLKFCVGSSSSQVPEVADCGWRANHVKRLIVCLKTTVFLEISVGGPGDRQLPPVGTPLGSYERGVCINPNKNVNCLLFTAPRFPRFRAFVLVTATCWWSGIWSIGAMVLSGDTTEVLGEKPGPVLLFATTNLTWTEPGSNSGLCTWPVVCQGQRPGKQSMWL
jgi:hypothetical protein